MWVKGKLFSITSLLGGWTTQARHFDKGAMVIFRLAPQDYHRVHSPVAGRIIEIKDIDGKLFTVNPIAVSYHASVSSP